MVQTVITDAVDREWRIEGAADLRDLLVAYNGNQPVTDPDHKAAFQLVNDAITGVQKEVAIVRPPGAGGQSVTAGISEKQLLGVAAAGLALGAAVALRD